MLGQAFRGGLSPILLGVLTFAAMGVTSLITGLFAHGLLNRATTDAVTWRQQARVLVLAVEVIDTALVLGLWISLAKRRQEAAPNEARPLVAWLLVTPLSGVALGINVVYHYVLQSYLQLPSWWETQEPWDLSVWTLVLVCVQPALVEEVFFRRLLYDALLPHARVTATICITSVTFGMAHIGAPFSIPVLILLGSGLGYLRWLAGSIWPCIFVHFLHNVVVVLLENAR